MAFQSFLTFKTRLRATCMRRRVTGSTMDLGLTRQLHISYQVRLSKLIKKLVKIFLHANVCLKWTDRQVCPSVRVLNGHLNLHVRPVRQPCPSIRTSSLLRFRFPAGVLRDCSCFLFPPVQRNNFDRKIESNGGPLTSAMSLQPRTYFIDPLAPSNLSFQPKSLSSRSQ